MDLISELYYKMIEKDILKTNLFATSESTVEEIVTLIKSEKSEKFLKANIENAIIDAQCDASVKAFREGFKAAFRLMHEVSE